MSFLNTATISSRVPDRSASDGSVLVEARSTMAIALRLPPNPGIAQGVAVGKMGITSIAGLRFRAAIGTDRQNIDLRRRNTPVQQHLAAQRRQIEPDALMRSARLRPDRLLVERLQRKPARRRRQRINEDRIQHLFPQLVAAGRNRRTNRRKQAVRRCASLDQPVDRLRQYACQRAF